MAGKQRNTPPFEAGLVALGWVFNRSCHCGGTYKLYYRKGANELKVLPNNKRFIVRHGVQGPLDNMLTLINGI